ncbi:hypothetical protein IWZ01DRAFT_540531 [Phyllosticta capitalensis]
MGMLYGPTYSADSRGPYMSRVSLSMCCLAILFVGVRLYSRFALPGAPGLDDLFISIATQVFLIAQTSAILMQIHSGWGEHAYELSLEQLNKSQMYRYQYIILNFIVAFFTKLSICWLVLRMTAGATTFGRRYRSIIKLVMWFLLVRVITTVIVQSIPCWPVSTYWHLETRPHGCFDLLGWMITTSAIETSTDIVVLLIPLPLICIVQLGKSERMILFSLFVLGAIPAGFAFTRTVQLIQWRMDGGTPISDDFSWYIH